MKIAVTKGCVVAVIVPMVASFSAATFSRRATMHLHATTDDVSDIVKAYAKKGKAEPKLPDIILPDPVETPIPQPEPVFSPPEVKVDVPELKPLEIPDIQAAVKDTVDQINAQVASLDLNAKALDIDAQFKGMNDFFKASQEQLAARAAEKAAAGPVPTLGEMFQNGVTSRRVTFAEGHTSTLPEGKAPSLIEYFANGFKSSAGGLSTDSLAEAKAKFAMLVDNTYSLFGKTSGSVDMASMTDGVSPEMAAGLGVAFLVLLGIASKNEESTSASAESSDVDDITDEIMPLSGLADDVKKMVVQTKALRDEILNLRNELKQTRAKLNEKELAISKERLNTADMELQLKREVQKISLKLQTCENAKTALEKKLAHAQGVKVVDMKVEIDEPPDMKVEVQEPPDMKLDVGEPPVIEVAVPEMASETLVIEATNDIIDEAVQISSETKPVKAISLSKKRAAPAKKATPKKAPAKKEIVAKVEEHVTAPAPKATDAEPMAAPAPKATGAKQKSKATIEKVTKVVAAKGDDSWSSLSASSLSRKTVKELTEYLNSKGLKTTGEDGKPLTKALLVDAIRAL